MVACPTVVDPGLNTPENNKKKHDFCPCVGLSFCK